MDREVRVLLQIPGGRSLISSPRGDQYWVRDVDGNRRPITVAEACQLWLRHAEHGLGLFGVEPSAPLDPEDFDGGCGVPDVQIPRVGALDRRLAESMSRLFGEALEDNLTADVPVSRGRGGRHGHH